MEKSEYENGFFLNNNSSDLSSLGKDKLIQELNELSVNSEKNKARMVEIAKVLLSEHYGYSKKKEESD